MPRRLLPVIAASVLLAACGPSGQDSPGQTPASPSSTAQPTPTSGAADHASVPPPGTQRFRSIRLGFYIDYPANMASSVSFDSRYLANDGWKTYAPPDTSGTSVLMLTLPGSNEVTAGELRIGIASDESEVRQCDKPSDAAQPDSRGEADINGTPFTTWKAGDAGMSHYLKVHSYRVVHGAYCYAIDLLVIGTNPEVYSPPKTPPFTHEEAFARLQKALQGFHFTR